MASEKVQEAAHVVEDQVKKAGELVTGAQKSASDAASSGNWYIVVTNQLLFTV